MTGTRRVTREMCCPNRGRLTSLGVAVCGERPDPHRAKRVRVERRYACGCAVDANASMPARAAVWAPAVQSGRRFSTRERDDRSAGCERCDCRHRGEEHRAACRARHRDCRRCGAAAAGRDAANTGDRGHHLAWVAVAAEKAVALDERLRRRAASRWRRSRDHLTRPAGERTAGQPLGLQSHSPRPAAESVRTAGTPAGQRLSFRPGWSACRAGILCTSSASRSARARRTVVRSRRRERSGRRRRASPEPAP